MPEANQQAPQNFVISTAQKAAEDRVLDFSNQSEKMRIRLAKAIADEETFISDFAGTPNGVFAVYGANLDKGGQLKINGQVPDVRVIRSDVIKGVLVAPGLKLKSGPVTVSLDNCQFKGML